PTRLLRIRRATIVRGAYYFAHSAGDTAPQKVERMRKQKQEVGNPMEYTQFGRTGLHVSRISYGTWQFGGDWGRVESAQWEAGKASVQKALDLGINFF